MTIIWKGPNLEDASIVVDGAGVVTMVPVIPYDAGDQITIEGSVEEYGGNPISVREGEDEVGTIQNIGVFKRIFEASGAGEFSLAATGQHRFGFLMVSKG